MENKITVCCPECDHKFSISIDKVLAENAEKDIKSKLEAEYQKKLKGLKKIQDEKAELEKQLANATENALLDARKELAEKEKKIKADAEKMATKKMELAMVEKENQLKEKQDMLDVTIAQKVNEAAQDVRSKADLKIAELQIQLDEQKKLAAEMQRKAGQGSMQLQGEVQELAIEEWLKDSFPLDTIDEIKKGARGADCLHIVNTRMRQACGSIYYESKRTKDFQKSWIEKFKTDMREKGAAFGVLVTDVMPDGLERMGQKDGIWICTYTEFKGLCCVLRDAVIRLSEAQATQENKGDKMVMLYDYLTGSEFRSRVEAIVEGFVQMKTDLDSERRAMESIWKKREKQIDKVALNTNLMYGSMKGIAGSSIGNIQALELPEG